ncbi:hypothetical protein OOO30_004622 [Salmonella enterica]|nr:hypothetical protein [Salmonella enterica]EKC2356364.1 hypothetical protein [Salmonella enterica]EKC2383938.1 hypothetical protein [Salmonella enterica]EKC2505638.1 hypothetical protein [Salmonella enterica]EKC2519967.1 hypothetical protein [Salmonella enterica]
MFDKITVRSLHANCPEGTITGSARSSIRPAGLIEEAQGNGTGKWHLRAEHEEQSLAGDVRRTEDYCPREAFLIAVCSLSAVTASGKTVMVSGVAPVTGITMIPGVPVSPSTSARLLFFSRVAVYSPGAGVASPAFNAAP